MKKLLLVIMALVVVSACSQNAKREGGTVAKVPANTAPATSDTAHVGTLAAVDSSQVMPDIAKIYKGIVIDVTSVADGKITSIEAPFAEKVALASSPYTIEVLSLFTDFTMVDGGVANKSLNEANPGAKVVVRNGDNVIFDGWLFQNFPTMHGFVDPEKKINITMKSTKTK